MRDPPPDDAARAIKRRTQLMQTLSLSLSKIPQRDNFFLYSLLAHSNYYILRFFCCCFIRLNFFFFFLVLPRARKRMIRNENFNWKKQIKQI